MEWSLLWPFSVSPASILPLPLSRKDKLSENETNLPEPEAGQRGREINLPGKLPVHLDPARPAPEEVLWDNTLSCWFQLASLFAKGEKSSITKIRLQASTDPEGIAESQFSWLVKAKVCRALSRGQSGSWGWAGGGDVCEHWGQGVVRINVWATGLDPREDKSPVRRLG